MSEPHSDIPDGHSPEETLRAIRQAIGAGVVALAVACLTYVVPGLADYRPWIDGDRVPFAKWLGIDEPEEEEAVDDSLLAEVEDDDTDVDDDDLIEPPPTVAPPVAPPTPEVKPPEPKVPVVPTPGPAEPTHPNEPSGPKSPNGPSEPTDPKTPTPKSPVGPEATPPTAPAEPERPPIVVAESEYENIPQELQLAEGTLDHFYRTLARTARAEKGAITRISHYGDSVIGADGTTSVVRRKLQKRFGTAGKGWVNAAPGWEYYRHKDVRYKPSGWKSKTVASNKLGDARWGKGRYGFGGVAGLGWGAKSSYEVYADRMELYYMAFPKGGGIKVRIDKGDWTEINTREEAVADRYKVFTAPAPGKHVFEVRASGGGNAHVYGVTLETAGPGIVYDALQMIGTRSSRLLNFDPDHIKAQVAHRAPDLQIFMYGGNESHDKGSMSVYEEKYAEVLKRMRAGRPDASCIVMTPVDHGEKYRGRIRTIPRLRKMIPIQRRLAEQAGCAFYDTFQAMGGDGAAGRWYKAELMSGDLAHMTRKGDKVLGAMFYKALMKGFADWLVAHPDA